jgi:hypothetical protein
MFDTYFDAGGFFRLKFLQFRFQPFLPVHNALKLFFKVAHTLEKFNKNEINGL